MAAVRFLKPEVVITQPLYEISLRNLVLLEMLIFEDMSTTKLEPAVDSRRQNVEHVENFNDVITMPPMVGFR